MSAVLALPEIFFGLAGMMLLLYGVFRRAQIMPWLVVAAFLLAAGLVVRDPSSGLAFHDMFISDAYSRFMKLALLGTGALVLAMSLPVLKQTDLAKPEYFVLMIFSMLGMMLMVSAHDLLAMYVGLELQGLPLYVLAAFRRDDTRSSEAGLKYFVLGAVASAVLLYGISLLYGHTGNTNFAALARALKDVPSLPYGAFGGLVFITVGMAFKVAAVPFHMWAPDVYEGAPTPVTAFFATAPKLAALALLTRLFLHPLGGLAHQGQQILVFVAVATMLLGSFAGLIQTNIKRLMAYSAIANAGTILVGLAAGGNAGAQSVLIYLLIYAVNVTGAFAVILSLRRHGEEAERIDDLAGLSKTHPLRAAAMAVFLFSLAGVPPLAGFFGKYFVFLAAVKAEMVPLAVIGVLASVVAAGYYVRLVKIMYFDEPTAEPLDPVRDHSLRGVTAMAALAVLLFAVYPAPLIECALKAAQSLFNA